MRRNGVAGGGSGGGKRGAGVGAPDASAKRPRGGHRGQYDTSGAGDDAGPGSDDSGPPAGRSDDSDASGSDDGGGAGGGGGGVLDGGGGALSGGGGAGAFDAAEKVRKAAIRQAADAARRPAATAAATIWAFFDLEACSGERGKSGTGDVVQIGACAWDGARRDLGKEFNECVKPHKGAFWDTQNLPHGITESTVEGCDRFPAVWARFSAWCGGLGGDVVLPA